MTKKKTKPRTKDVSAERLRQFVEAYMGEAAGNGAAAARAAGYTGTPKKLSERASVLLRRADVVAMMEARAKADPAVATREQRQQMWTRWMLGEHVEQTALDGSIIKAPVPVALRLKASELLGRAQGDFVERREHLHSGRVEFVVAVPPRDVLPEPES